MSMINTGDILETIEMFTQALHLLLDDLQRGLGAV